MELQDRQKKALIDVVAHLYLRHKRMDGHIERLASYIEIEEWDNFANIYELLLACQNEHREIGLKLEKLRQIVHQ